VWPRTYDHGIARSSSSPAALHVRVAQRRGARPLNPEQTSGPRRRCCRHTSFADRDTGSADKMTETTAGSNSVEVVDPGEVCGFLPMASSNQSVEGKQPDEQAGGSVPPGVQQMAPDNGWTRAHFRVFDDREMLADMEKHLVTIANQPLLLVGLMAGLGLGAFFSIDKQKFVDQDLYGPCLMIVSLVITLNIKALVLYTAIYHFMSHRGTSLQVL